MTTNNDGNSKLPTTQIPLNENGDPPDQFTYKPLFARSGIAHLIECEKQTKRPRRNWDPLTLEQADLIQANGEYCIGLIPSTIGVIVIDVDKDASEFIRHLRSHHSISRSVVAIVPSLKTDRFHVYLKLDNNYHRNDPKEPESTKRHKRILQWRNLKTQIEFAYGETRADKGYVIVWRPQSLIEQLTSRKSEKARAVTEKQLLQFIKELNHIKGYKQPNKQPTQPVRLPKADEFGYVHIDNANKSSEGDPADNPFAETVKPQSETATDTANGSDAEFDGISAEDTSTWESKTRHTSCRGALCKALANGDKDGYQRAIDKWWRSSLPSDNPAEYKDEIDRLIKGSKEWWATEQQHIKAKAKADAERLANDDADQWLIEHKADNPDLDVIGRITERVSDASEMRGSKKLDVPLFAECFKDVLKGEYQFDGEVGWSEYKPEGLWRLDSSGHYLASMVGEVYTRSEGKVLRSMRMSGVTAHLQTRLFNKSPRWNKLEFLRGLPNGWTLDVKTGIVRKSKPSEYISKQLGTIPERGECPNWLKVVNHICFGEGKTERYGLSEAEFLQVLLGYFLSYSYTHHYFIALTGQAGGGKSTLAETVMAVANMEPDASGIQIGYGVGISGSDLVGKSNAHKQVYAVTEGCTSILADDIPAGKVTNISEFKILTAGGYLNANYMNRNSRTFRSRAHLIATGNELPIVTADSGYNRRQIPIDVPGIPKRERDTELGDKLRKELPAIAQWLIDGMSMYYENPALLDYLPERWSESAEEYKSDNDPIGEFFNAHYEWSNGGFVYAKQVVDDYNDYYSNSNFKWNRVTQFKRWLKQHHFDKGVIHDETARGFYGFQAKPKTGADQ